MNLFATVLTHPAPTANYRGESELNRTVIQKIADGRHEYPIISPESMRNALREILTTQGFPTNRRRLQPVAGEGDEKQQLAVSYKDLPDPAAYIDDFVFGYLLAVKGRSSRMSARSAAKTSL
jgi:CRISPR-associated protein Cst2